VPLKIAFQGTLPSNVYSWVGYDQGIFSRHGLNVTLQSLNGDAAMKSQIAGEVDAGIHGGPQLPLTAHVGGSPLKIVAALTHVYNGVLVVPADITSPQQLKGRKVGAASLTAINALATRRLLQKYGLEEGRDYNLVVTGAVGSDAGQIAELVAGHIDGVVVQPEPFARQATADGKFRVLLDMADDADLQTAAQTVVFTADYAKQHPDVVQKTVDSYIETVRYLKEHKAETEQGLRTHFNMDDQAAIDALYDREAKILAKEPSVGVDQFTDVIASMPKGGPAISDDQVASLVDNHYVEDAAKRGLTNY